MTLFLVKSNKFWRPLCSLKKEDFPHFGSMKNSLPQDLKILNPSLVLFVLCNRIIYFAFSFSFQRQNICDRSASPQLKTNHGSFCVSNFHFSFRLKLCLNIHIVSFISIVIGRHFWLCSGLKDQQIVILSGLCLQCVEVYFYRRTNWKIGNGQLSACTLSFQTPSKMHVVQASRKKMIHDTFSTENNSMPKAFA